MLFTLGNLILSAAVIESLKRPKALPMVLVGLVYILSGILVLQGAGHERRVGPDGPPFWLARIGIEFFEGPWQRFEESAWKDVALVATAVLGTAGWAMLAACAGWESRWLVTGVFVVWPLAIVAGIGVRGLFARRRGAAGSDRPDP